MFFFLIYRLFYEQTSFCIGASLDGWTPLKYISKQQTTGAVLWLTSRVEKAQLSCLPVCVCLSSQYEFHSLLLLPLSEECSPLSIQYYDSLSLNCFLRGPCSPYLGRQAALPLLHRDVLSFLLELFGKAVCLWAATLMEHSTTTSVGNM